MFGVRILVLRCLSMKYNRVQPLGIVPVVAKSIVHSTHFLFPQAQISVKRGVKRETVWRCCGYIYIFFLSLF